MFGGQKPRYRPMFLTELDAEDLCTEEILRFQEFLAEFVLFHSFA